MKQEIGIQIDDVALRMKELQKTIISLKALKCPKCKEIVWTDEVHNGKIECNRIEHLWHKAVEGSNNPEKPYLFFAELIEEEIQKL